MKRLSALLCALALSWGASAWAAIGTPVLQNTKSQAPTAQSTTTIATTADIAIGEGMVASVINQSSRTLSSISGATGCTWNYLQGGVFASNKHLAAAWCVATAPIPAGTVLTVTLSGGSIFGVALHSVTGLDTVSTVDLGPAWASGTGTAASVTDASTHPSADTIGFGFTFSVDGEVEGMTPSASTTNGAFTGIATIGITGLGKLGQSWKIVSATDQVTRVDTIGSRSWKAGTIWFKAAAGGSSPTPHNCTTTGAGRC